VKYEERVDTIIDWLSLGDQERPSFITLYFDQPDDAAHTYGPDRKEVKLHNLTFVILFVGQRGNWSCRFDDRSFVYKIE
jgi:hypothetical protein